MRDNCQTTFHFDGDPLNISTFISSYDSFVQILARPNDVAFNSFLFKAIISKLKGKAAQVASVRNATIWDALRTLLINTFSDRRNELTLISELQHLQQHTNESATDFGELNIDNEELEELLHTDENIRLSSEEVENILNDLEHENDLLDTVNSKVEDGSPKSIPIQDEAINNKQQQIYVKTVHINPQPVKFTITNSQLIQDFMKSYLQPNQNIAISPDRTDLKLYDAQSN
ncbi:hypothetical protein Trydic_g12602 [Trypoxylus dichotomus]